MIGISVRDLLNRGIGFRAGVIAVYKALGYESAATDAMIQRLVDAYVKSLIAAHSKS